MQGCIRKARLLGFADGLLIFMDIFRCKIYIKKAEQSDRSAADISVILVLLDFQLP